MPESSVAEALATIQDRIAETARKSGRDAAAVRLIAISKTNPPELLREAVVAEQLVFGENRVQEAAAKRASVKATTRWHLIGQLQRNKVGRAIDIFDVVHSVDSIRLADALDRRVAETGGSIEALLQVNTSGGSQQAGADPESLPALLDHVAGLDHLQVSGLMTIAAHSQDSGIVRACFRQLHDLAQQHRHRGSALGGLSMGMSGDYEIAIEEGATMIRVGTVIFGERVSHG